MPCNSGACRRRGAETITSAIPVEYVYQEDWESPIVPTAPRPPQQETVFARDIENTHPVNASGAVIRNPR